MKNAIFTKIILFILIFSFSLGTMSFVAAPLAHAGELQDALKEKAVEVAQNFMLKVLEAIKTWMEKARTRANNNDAWTDEQKSRVISAIDDVLVWVDESKDKIEATTENEALKSLADELKAEWNDHKVNVKMAYIENWIENGQKALDDWEAAQNLLEEKAELVREAAQEQGLDTTQLDTLVDKLDSEIEDSKTKLKEAMKYIELMKEATGSEALDYFRKAREAVIAAIVNLMNDGRQAFKDVITEVVELYKEALAKQ